MLLAYHQKVKKSEYFKNLEINPQSLYISLSNACNLKCQYCRWHGENSPNGNKNKSIMQWDVVNAITHQASRISTLNCLILCGGGSLF